MVHYEIMITQLNDYSKYNDPTQVVQDITSRAQVVCEADLKNSYYFRSKEAHLYLSFTVLLPILLMANIVACVRSMHKEIDKKLTESRKSYPFLAGFTLAAVYFFIFVIFMDAIAVYYYASNNHEYSEDNVLICL